MNTHGGARQGSGRKPMIDAESLSQLLDQQTSYAEVARQLGVATSSVRRRAQKLNFARCAYTHRNPANPWNLSPHQCRVMDLLCEIGHATGVAERLDTHPHRINASVRDVLNKMQLEPRAVAAAIHKWTLWRYPPRLPQNSVFDVRV